MATAAERVVTLMSRPEKVALERKAQLASRYWGRKVSTAEIVREAVRAYDVTGSNEEEAELRSLLAAFNSLHPETLAMMDRAEQALDQTLAYFEGKSAP